MGTTGNSTGVHLHFAVATSMYGAGGRININPDVINYIYDLNPPHIHDYTSAITKQPTCTEAGIKTNTCPCGDTYTEAISATGHKYLIEEVDPTLESEGYSIYTCEVCGDTYKDNIIPQIVIGEDGWYYAEKLPKDISDFDYEIQYQHSYQKKATSSPGKDWVKGELAESGYVFVGEPFTTAKQVATSDTLVMTDYYFYHYCGGSAGAEANYEQTDKFVHYDYIRPEHQVVVQSTGMDGEYPYFVLGWANDNSTVFCLSGTTCDGSAGDHGTRSKAWYRMATYQNCQLADYYYYSKQSDWEADEDSAASVVTYRYRPNNTGMMGDVNSDGEFNAADVVLLQKWLLAVPDTQLTNWKAADLCEDDKLDVFDLCMMKRMLVENS
ncbi:MAG: dockerin type I repeat-containing protein [Ruminococcus sp.]|nr:dockerin type I repeat-containing protein [Ruminococcus sp.]